ncbi:MAG: outer membrane lipoprotein chaperone LolA [candidate division NC10 bacterium]|nr:outer membrane lipoprotein chaperone LolA [candidate division NC10 bacterium]
MAPRDRSRRRVWLPVCALAWGLVLGPGVPPGLLAAAAAKAGPDVDEVVAKVEVICAKTQDLSARFRQTVTNRSLGAVREGGGSFMLKRPGKVRWEYETPEPRLFVTDGKTLWDYSPVDKQARAQALDEVFSSRLPLAFLAGDCQLRRDFAITAVEHAGTRASPSSRVLDLRPLRADAGIARMLLEVNLQGYTVEKTTLFDAAGNTTVIALTDLKLNSGLSDQQFQFTPPAGVTVVPPPSR